MSPDDLLKVKGGVSKEGASVEAVVGGGMPGTVARLFPKVWARARTKQAITDQLVKKIEQGEALDMGDVQFLSDIGAEAETRWARRKEIAARAQRALAESPATLLLEAAQTSPAAADVEDRAEASPPTAAGGGSATAEDWIDKFWADAELVSDKLLQEVYGRILASEAQRPGKCSMRTLRALRYLDRVTAEQFAAISPFVLENKWLPNDKAFFRKFNLDYQLMLELDDAGLLDASGTISWDFGGDPEFVRLGTTVIRLSGAKGQSVLIFPLRLPGRELHRISQVKQNADYCDWAISWFQTMIPRVSCARAEMPSPEWQGAQSDLQWTTVARTI